MTRYRVTVAYDGSDYHGFQRLPTVPTVQGALEAVLSLMNRNQSVAVTGAGRTDSGVHASGQVIAFDLEWRHSLDQLQHGLNRLLPSSIAVSDLQVAPVDFHPRFDARSRVYRYRVLIGYSRDVMTSRYVWQLPYAPDRIDLSAMNIAAAMLIGTRDFGSFGTPPESDGGTKTTIRDLIRCEWMETDLSSSGSTRTDGRSLAFLIEANSFLYHQVRSTVGALVDVGLGKWSVSRFADALEQPDRTKVKALAPAHGLSLIGVTY